MIVIVPEAGTLVVIQNAIRYEVDSPTLFAFTVWFLVITIFDKDPGSKAVTNYTPDVI